MQWLMRALRPPLRVPLPPPWGSGTRSGAFGAGSVPYFSTGKHPWYPVFRTGAFGPRRTYWHFASTTHRQCLQ